MTRLFELRKERGISQRNMADEFNVSQSTYNNWENSNTQPSIEQLIALARFFGVSVDYLVGNSDDVGTISYISTLSPEERHILGVYSSLPSSLKTAFVAILNAVSDNDKHPVAKASHPHSPCEGFIPSRSHTIAERE